MKVKFLFVLLVIVALTMGFHSNVYSEEQGYPNKQIQLIVNLRAGGGVDLFFRMLATELSKYWKVQVTIENQTGGGGITGANTIANSKKDGYTLLGTLVESLSTMTAAKPKGPIHLLRDFDPIFVNINYGTTIYAVRNDSKLRTLKDIINYAKEKPGELICGTPPRGTQIYLEWELFKRITKIDVTTLPFSGTAEVFPQVLGGHLQIGGFSDVAAKPYIDSGKLWAFVSHIKSQVLPNVPTFAESGYPQVNLAASIALLGPKDLPPSIIKSWENALQAIFNDPKFLTSLEKLGFRSNLQIGVNKNTDFFKGEIQKYSQFTPAELGWE